MFLYPAKGALDRNRSNVKILLPDSRTGSVEIQLEQKKDFDGIQCPWGPGSSSYPRPAAIATTIQSTQLSCVVTSPPLLSNPYPQQDILRLAGIQCQYSLRPQPVVQTWKLHHRGKMVLFQWKSTTLSKHSSYAKAYAEFRSRRNFSSNKE